MFLTNNNKSRWIALSFLVSILLLAVKFYAFYLTNSKAILTDALESIVNVVASGFAIYSIYLSAQPRDHNHPYGHGKIEFFSAGLEGTLIILAGLFIIYQAVLALIHPEPLGLLPTGMALVGLSGAINGWLGYMLMRKGKDYNSLTLEADGRHILTDAASSVVLLVGIAVIYYTGYFILDSVLSIIFSMYIILNGYLLVRKSIAGLMDESNPKAMKATVKILNRYRKDNWIDVHNMRVQQYGGDRHIDLHLTLPYYYDLRAVHDEVHQVEEALEENLPGFVEVFVHADPCIPEKCCHYCRVSNCPVRMSPNTKKVLWNESNMAKNQKHYHEST
ncbi:MAG TPA: cation diffusion facilitator family transporter [Cyclobacteriaceae bacterium]|nr:cation diffusion facilitator family transporter [Cyclobacteriaceae bacterium]